MNRSTIALAVLSVAAFAAQAESPNASGQFAAGASQTTRAAVQAQLVEYKQSGVNPWSTSYNPVRAFKGERSRDAVKAEYLASRQAVSAMTGEDSGSSYLARRQATGASSQLAGQPANSAR